MLEGKEDACSERYWEKHTDRQTVRHQERADGERYWEKHSDRRSGIERERTEERDTGRNRQADGQTPRERAEERERP